jgi:type IV pilus assembly protein PilE
MRKSTGFTLIELLIVITIVGILGSIVFPSYQNSVRKSKRSDAIAELQSLIAAQERYFLDNRKYANQLTALGFASDAWATDYYSIEAGACQDGSGANMDFELCVELTATGTGSQAQDGKIIMNTIGRSVHVDTDDNETQL